MREYPRMVYKSKENYFSVKDAEEEFEAGLNGYNSHWMSEVNEVRKGTAEEILRVNPELEKKRLAEEKAKQFSADLIEVAKKAILEDREMGFQPHNGDNMLNREKVLEVAVEAVREEMPKLKDDTEEMIEEMEDSPYVKFEAITGFKAICDRGPYKGQETKGFKEWMKNGSDR